MNEILLNNYKEPNFLIPQVELYINILETEVIVDATLQIKRNDNNVSNPLILNGKDLKLESLQINNDIVHDYNYSNELLTIRNVPDNFMLKTRVIINPYNNKSMEGLYKSGNILCSQNEAEGFRRITFFMDRPDIMSSYTITIEGNKSSYPNLLSNGNLINTLELPNNRFSNTWEDPFKKPCYLVAVVAGNLDVIKDSFTTMSNREIALEIYTDPGKSNQAKHGMESLKKSMKWDEETFGLEYDLNLYMIVAVDTFNAGAMENKGLNIFNSVYVLADPETATDTDFESIEGVIAHEYFHNWTGNRVTCRDWFQLTLKEGLTVYRDHEFSSDMTDRTVKRIDDVSLLRTYQYPEDKGPNSHPIKPKSYLAIDNFYTATVYEKGAEVIRMINTLIGKENFIKGMDLYFLRHTGEAVTTEDFVSAMEDASNMDLKQFKLWYSQAGTPVIDVEAVFNNEEYTLKITQTLPKTSYNGSTDPMYFPLNLGLYSKDGSDLTPLNKKQIIISKNYQEFKFKSNQMLVPSLFQGFSAPVIVNYNYSIDDLITLLNYDKDLFNKFDSARRLTMYSIDNIVKSISNNKHYSLDSRITKAFKNILEDSSIEKRFLAKLLYIPEIKDIALNMEEYDFILANKARNVYLELFSKELKSTLFRLFENNVTEKYAFNKSSVAKRSIKNKALYILSFLGCDIEEIALKQFNTSDNMTDYLAAYSTLQNCSDEIRITANNNFYRKWSNNFLVMNKWFSVQAQRDNKLVLEEIETLSKDKIFDKTNPNRIRSLFTSFSSRNLAQFHREDGKGYKFIADIIMEVDSYNSHVSASIASGFQAYKYLKPKQAELMKEQLEIILNKENISTGLFEIISKTLKARD